MKNKQKKLHKGSRIFCLKLIRQEKFWNNKYKCFRSMWLCKCDCGNIRYYLATELKLNRYKSCGCYRLKSILKRITKHGMCGTQFYGIWQAMLSRCCNKNVENYSYYGGRGIKVCKRWLGKLGFIYFMKDMYSSYLQHIKKYGKDNTSLDRINVNRDYKPSNCKWSTKEKQSRNTRMSSKTINYKLHFAWRFKLKKIISALIRGDQKSSKLYMKYLGCSSQEFLDYIESLWLPRMSWDNYGNYTKKNPYVWNIDHINEVRNFDLSKIRDRYICFNYKNLRPMWGRDNLKRNKLEDRLARNVIKGSGDNR